MSPQYNILIPKTRLRRELNQWLRWIKKNPDCSVIATRKNVSMAVLTSNFSKNTDLFAPFTLRIVPDDIFSILDKNRKQLINSENPYYERSKVEEGCIDQVMPDGTRRTGHFIDGQFIEVYVCL